MPANHQCQALLMKKEDGLLFFRRGDADMNRIYKVIWSKAKNAYVVTSEIAKTYTKSAGSRTGKMAAILAAAAVLSLGFGIQGGVYAAEENIPGVEVINDQVIINDMNKVVLKGIGAGDQLDRTLRQYIAGQEQQHQADLYTFASLKQDIGENKTEIKDAKKTLDGKADRAGDTIGGVTLKDSDVIADHILADQVVANTAEFGTVEAESATIGGVSIKDGQVDGVNIKGTAVQVGKNVDQIARNKEDIAKNAKAIADKVDQADLDGVVRYDKDEETNKTKETIGGVLLKNNAVSVEGESAGIRVGTVLSHTGVTVQSKDGRTQVGDTGVYLTKINAGGSTSYASLQGNELKVQNALINPTSYSTATADGFFTTGTFNGLTLKGDVDQAQVAIGTGANATGWGATAVGAYAKAANNGAALGDKSVAAEGAVAVGFNAQAQKGWGVSVGANSVAADLDTTAIGRNSKANKGNSVALGAGSVADEYNVVSVGSGDPSNKEHPATRKIVNVADGTIAEGSHDAVTGGQLAAAGIIPGKTSNATNYASQQVALGQYSSTAGAENATAIGGNAVVAKGASESVALGHNSTVTYGNVLETGALEKQGVVSVGNSEKGIVRRIINVADGVKDNDAVNKGQLDKVTGDLDFKKTNYLDGAKNLTAAAKRLDTQVGKNEAKLTSLDKAGIVAGVAGQDSVAINGNAFKANGVAVGVKSSVTANNGTALGYESNVQGAQGTAIGFGSLAKEENSTALGANAEANAKNSVAIGYGTKAARENTVAFGNRQLTGVAAGSEETDAVNVKQLTDATEGVVKWDKGTTNTIHGVTLNDGNVFGKSAQLGNVILRDGQVFAAQGATLGGVTVSNPDSTTGLSKVSGVAAGTEDSDAVNYKQLQEVQTAAGKHSIVEAGDKNVIVTDVENDGQHTYSVALGENISVKGVEAETISATKVEAETISATNATLKGLLVEGDSLFTSGSNSISFGKAGIQIVGNTNVAGSLSVNNVAVATQDDIKNVNQNVSNLSNKVDQVTNRVDTLESSVDKNTTDIETLKKGVDTNAENIGKNTEAIKQNSDAIKQNSDAIANNTARLDTAEETLKKHTEQINQNTADIAQNKQDIANNKAAIEQNKNDIAANRADIDKNSEAITANSEKIDNLEKSSSATNAQVRENKTNIEKNAAAIAQEQKDREQADADLKAQIGDTTKYKDAGITDKDGKAVTNVVDATISNKTAISAVDKKVGDGKLINGADDLTSGINQNSTAINNLGYSVNKLGGEIDSVGALSAALAGLHPLDYNPADSKYQLAAAFGGYDGSYALALGGFYNVNQDILLSGGVSTILKGERKTAGNVGVTFRVGAGNSAKDLGTPEDLKEANQQLAALKQDNKVLTGENRKLAEKVESQDQKIADLEAKFEELLKKVK